MRSILILSTAAILALGPPIQAANCGGGPIQAIETPVGIFYVDDRDAVYGDGIWIYKEKNDVDGLQQGGCSLPDHCDPCIDDLAYLYGPDLLIY